MPCLTGRFDPAIGPTLQLGIAAPGSFRNAGAGTQPAVLSFPALVDTGASATCIAPGVATRAGLRPVGERAVTSATHSTPVNTYLVDLLLPFGSRSYILSGHTVIEFPAAAAGSPYQGLLGRDVIGQGALMLSFDDHFTFCL